MRLERITKFRFCESSGSANLEARHGSASAMALDAIATRKRTSLAKTGDPPGSLAPPAVCLPVYFPRSPLRPRAYSSYSTVRPFSSGKAFTSRPFHAYYVFTVGSLKATNLADGIHSASRPSATSRSMEDLHLLEDDELVSRTQAGDTQAFDVLWHKYSPRIYSLVYNMTSNHEDSNDLLLEVFAKAFRAISGFKGKSSFYTWIHAIAVNMTINFVKKRGRRYQMSLDDFDSNIHNDKEFIELTASNTPIREVDLSELQQRLNEAMMKLSVEHRAVVTMFDIQGMPHAEIAKVLGVPEATVRSRLFYAHRQLQNYLEEFRKQ
jgi:RNA polymerase sigma factor (sigma-70 family)